MTTPPSGPNRLPKTPPLNIIALRVRLQHVNLKGDTDVHAITGEVTGNGGSPFLMVSVFSLKNGHCFLLRLMV